MYSVYSVYQCVHFVQCVQYVQLLVEVFMSTMLDVIVAMATLNMYKMSASSLVR